MDDVNKRMYDERNEEEKRNEVGKRPKNENKKAHIIGKKSE